MRKLLAAAMVAVGLLSVPALTAKADDRDVTLHNQTGLTITHFYTREYGASQWVPVDGGGLHDNRYTNLGFHHAGSCHMDFMAQTVNGTYDWSNWDFCSVSDIYLTWNGSAATMRASGN